MRNERRDGVSPEDKLKDIAFKEGRLGSYEFSGTSLPEKAAFESGLNLFLKDYGMHGISSSDISDKTVLKGFLYCLLANGVMSYSPFPAEQQQALFDSKFDEIVNQYDGRILKGESEAAEKKNKFLSGAAIATDYIIFCNFHLPIVHGLHRDDIPVEQLKRHFKIYREIAPMLYLTEDPLRNMINFYVAKSGVAELVVNDNQLRFEEVDSLAFILNNIRYLLKREQALGTIGDSSFLDIDIEQEYKRVDSLWESAVRRTENPKTFRVEEELRAAIELEEFELAARLHDELKEIQMSSKKKASEK